MPELLKSYVVRNAEQLTPKQIETAGIFSHPPGLQSARYAEWHNLCQARQYKKVETQMRRFLESEEAIRSFDQIPSTLRMPIKFADYNGYRFKKEDFLSTVDRERLSEEFGERGEDGRYPDKSNFRKVYSNLADQLVARATIPDPRLQSVINEQAVLRTLRLIEHAYAARQEFDVSVKDLYSSPIILPHCLVNMNPCRDVTYISPVRSQDTQIPVTANKCECKCNTECLPQNPCCAKIIPYIADLFVVRDELRCYEVGEMSYIENVIESEIRSRKHRHLEREEFLTERTGETAFSEEKDHQVDEQFSLQMEISKAVEQELSLDAGVTVNYNWGTGSVAATTDTGFNVSKKDVQNSVQKYSKQVIDKAVTKLETKTKEFASRKFIRELEETNKHVFGGLAGAPADISRQFYYVTQVKKAQVFNYGRRMLLDLYIPEPSELYKHLLAKQFKLKEPEEPTIVAGEINGQNYLELIRTYGLKDVDAPPKMTEQVRFTVNEQFEKPKKGKTGLKAGTAAGFTVPDGYKAVSWHSDGPDIVWDGAGVSVVISLAGKDIVYPMGSPDITQTPLPDLVGNQSVTFQAFDVLSMQLDITVECELLPEIKSRWQLSVYDKILAIYYQQVTAYEEALVKFEKYKQEKYRQNPFILLQEIQAQLKQAAISYISCQFYDSMNAMKRRVEPCGFPSLDLPEAEKEGRFVRFFEQAFEWKFMSYIFYPSFWAAKCTWEGKFKEEAENMLFQQFLKAGNARLSVPVRPGFEGHVCYFLNTKQIWGQTGQPPISGPDFVPLYQEIKEEKDNFNTDRNGAINVLNGVNTITLNGADSYWNYGNPSAQPPVLAGVDSNKIAADIGREILIDCKQYRIVDIQPLTTPNSWQIILDKPYEGTNANDLPWSTGALFVGAPWEFRIPTRLVWLRQHGRCLPCYPIKCEE